MQIEILSNKRGILSLYDGNKYIIYSQFYGVVAESTSIERKNVEREELKDIGEIVKINFNICKWYGYWDLKTIITRGINKLEKRYINKDITINYNTIENTDNSLDNRMLTFEVIDR